MLIYKVMELTATERDALYEFYQNRFGSYELFWYFDFQNRKWIDQYVGRGDGIEQTFDLPGYGTGAFEEGGFLTEAGDRLITEAGDVIVGDSLVTRPTIYVDGVEIEDYSFHEGTGEGGADQIIFGLYTPALGSLITADFTGYLRIQGRFRDDKLTEELIVSDPNKRFENLSVSIYEVRYT